MTDERLDRVYAQVISDLDTDRRAWIVGLGAYPCAPGERGARIESVLARAFCEGTFPSGPFPFYPDDVAISHPGADGIPGDEDVATAIFDLDPGRLLECRMSVREGVVAICLSRGGCLDDGSHEPSHVMLSDVEAMLSDTIALLRAKAHEDVYAGPCLLRLGIVSAVPGRPLELRVFDEGAGEVLRPPAGYNAFEPISVTHDIRDDEDAVAMTVWDAALEISLQFGAFEPQLLTQPERVPALY